MLIAGGQIVALTTKAFIDSKSSKSHFSDFCEVCLEYNLMMRNRVVEILSILITCCRAEATLMDPALPKTVWK